MEKGFASYEIGTDTKVLSPFIDMTLTHDAAEEYTLPDYYPEIRRVLSVTARALPESKYLSENKMECGGTVTFCILYVGDDGKITSAPYAFAYTASTALPQSNPKLSCITADTRAESPSCRVLAPRRISLKTRLKTRILADKMADCEERVSAADSSKITPADELAMERKKEKLKSAFRTSAAYTGSVSGAVNEQAALTPISCDGVVHISSARAMSDAVAVRGEAVISVLCATDDGRYITLKGKEPIEASIPCDGASDGDMARAWGLCAASGAKVSDTMPGRLDWEMEYDLGVEAVGERYAQVTRDLYSTEYETDVTFGETEILSPLAAFMGNVSCDGSAPLESAGAQLICANAEAVADKLDVSKGRGVVSGTCTVKAVLGGDEIRTAELAIPFTCEWDISQGGAPEGGECVSRCDVRVIGLGARVDGDKLLVNGEIGISVMMLSKNKSRAVAAAVIDRGAPIVRRDNEIKLYYPEKDDTMWSIAKKYHVPMADLERENGAEITGTAVIL